MPDYQSLSRAQLIEALEHREESAATFVTPMLRLIGSPAQDGTNIYIGNPNPDDLASINKLTGRNDPAEEWTVFPFLASDNILNYNYRVWSANTLEQMERGYIGANLILNHDSGNVESSVGFIFDAKLYQDNNPSEEILNASIFGEVNKTITDQDGYKWLLLKGAVQSGTAASEAGLYRRAQACSTGFWLYDQRTICPDCSKSYGREVEFEEEAMFATTDGKEIVQPLCPHLPITLTNLMIWDEYGQGPDPLWSSYVIKDGKVDVIELSLCVDGALPMAGIIRS